MAPDIFQNRAAQREAFIKNMQNAGYECRINERGDIWGVRRGTAARQQSVFRQSELIKGMKAYYGKEYFRVVGGAIIERVSGRCVDIVAA